MRHERIRVWTRPCNSVSRSSKSVSWPQTRVAPSEHRNGSRNGVNVCSQAESPTYTGFRQPCAAARRLRWKIARERRSEDALSEPMKAPVEIRVLERNPS